MSPPRVIRRRVLFRGRVFDLVRDEVAIGTHRIIREGIRHPGGVVVVPMLDRSRVLLVRQYRHAVKQSLLELPAGTLKPGEGKMTCARREVAEETGWWPQRLRLLTRFYALPGYASEELTVFVGEGMRRMRKPPKGDDDEYVRPVVLTLSEAMAAIASGRIRDAKTMIGILLVACARRRA